MLATHPPKDGAAERARMDTAAMLARVAFSLAVVIGLMWVLAKFMRGKSAAQRNTSSLSVVTRMSVGRRSSIAVLAIGDRHLVVGVTDEHINLLADLPAPPEIIEAVADPRRTTIDLAATTPIALSGSATELLAIDSAASPSPAGTTAAVTSVEITAKTSGPLTGSILSPTTWKQTVNVIRERTVRR